MNRFNGHVSVGFLQKRKLRSLFLLAQHEGKIGSFTEDNGLFWSKFYLKDATEAVWRQAIGHDRFNIMLMVLNQKNTCTPYKLGL